MQAARAEPADRWSDTARSPVGPNRVGTLRWARGTGGRLRPRDRLRLLGQGVLFQLSELPSQFAGRLGLRPGSLARLDLDDLRIPDSPACREAEELCSELRPEMLVNHSYRTYVWATVLAAHKGLRYDEEVLYLASLLHDLGLSDGHETSPAPTCFTLVGAAAAEQTAFARGWSEERGRAAAEAITLHMNLRTPLKGGVEAHLMAAGTQLDLVGKRYFRIEPTTVAAVLERFPRDGVKKGMRELFHAQSRGHPGSRARLYQRYFGLPLLVRAAPFKR